MRLSAVALVIGSTAILLCACEKQELAALDDRGNKFYGRGGVVALPVNQTHGTYTDATAQPAAEAIPVVSYDIAPPAAGIPAKVNTTTTSAAAAASTTAPAVAVSGWQWPVTGKVIELFGEKTSGIVNEGIVIAAPAGTPIQAVQAGSVAFVGKDTKNYGNIVILRHADGDMTSYAHAQSIAVKKGDHVARGAVIAYVGKSGGVKQPQLHFAVREGKESVDPLSKLPRQVASN